MRLSRNLVATALTVAVLAAGLVVALRDRLPDRGTAAGDPSDVFWEMIDTMREGAADAYVDLFAGELREQLETARDEMGDAAFEQELRDQAADIKGIAVTGKEVWGDTMRLEVEYVQETSYEAGSLDVRKVRGRWRIVALGPTHEREPPVPYGTPVGPSD